MNKELLEKLKKKRAAIRTQTTKILSNAETLINEENDLDSEQKSDSLNILKEQLIEKHDALKLLNNDIENNIPDSEFEAEIEGSESYSEKIIEWKYKITKFLQNKPSKNKAYSSDASSINSESSVPKSTGQNIINLPKLNIGKFYGDSSYWLEFWSQFSNAIDNNDCLSQIDKFSYLKSLLGGSAANAISGFTLSEENYKSALTLLKDRYGRKDLVISTHMNKLLNLNAVKYSSNIRALRELFDNCEIQIRNLNSLGVTAGSYGHLLCPVLLKLIPSDIALEFNRKRVNHSDWDINELMKFIKHEVESREVTGLVANPDNYNVKNERIRNQFNKRDIVKNDRIRNQIGNRDIPSTSALFSNFSLYCIYCNNNDHVTDKCNIFSNAQKREKLKNLGRCFLCYKKFHISSKCNSNVQCKICRSKFHNTSLCHKNNEQNRETPFENAQTESETIVSAISQLQKTSPSNSKQVLLQTCCVKVESGKNSAFSVCLLDSGSQKTFITEKLAFRLKTPILRKEKLLVYAFGSREAKEREYSVVELWLKNVKDGTRSICLEALVTDVISGAIIHTPSLNEETQQLLSKYEISSCGQKCTCELGILIGADYLWTINEGGRVDKITKSLYICESLFGWSLCGAIDNEYFGNKRIDVLNIRVMKEGLDEDLRKLWELEGIGIKSNDETSNRDLEIMNKFESNLKFENNRYTTNLLWKDQKENLGSNFKIAKKRFFELNRKLTRDIELFDKYKDIVEKQKENKIIEKVPFENCNGYFMPHWPVIRFDKSTTRVRMVFDASSKEQPFSSLNDCLLPGPNLNPNILDTIINFRKNYIAFSADLAEAFHQVGVDVADRDFLKFLWFSSNSEKYFEVLRFTRAPFGVACSPFILAATIRHHVKKYENTYSEAVKMLNTSLYVDDLMYGSQTVEKAHYLSLSGFKILEESGMHLRKFNTNPEVLRGMWEKDKLDCQEMLSDVHKVLGISWDTNSDVLKLDIQGLIENRNFKPTKRNILKVILKLFDPVGFIMPFVMRMKSLLQETWLRGFEWDVELPLELKNEWESWYSEIGLLRKFEIPRGSNASDKMEIHIFCDASQKGVWCSCVFKVRLWVGDKNKFCLGQR